MNVNPVNCITSLPENVKVKILVGYLPVSNIVHSISLVNKNWYNVIENSNELWRKLVSRDFLKGGPFCSFFKFRGIFNKKSYSHFLFESKREIARVQEADEKAMKNMSRDNKG